MKTTIIAGVCCLLLMATCAYAQQPTDAAVNRLAHVEQFAIGPVGFAGKMSTGEKDYRVILSSPSALMQFQKLYRIGNLQAKSYALLGVRQVDVKEFQKLLASLEGPSAEVITESGCIVLHERFVVVVKRIAAGKYDWNAK